MRTLICIVMVISLFATAVASTMHLHASTGSTSTIVHAPADDGGSGSTMPSHAAACHACAHHVPSMAGIARIAMTIRSLEHPLSVVMSMALGGDWLPLSRPPR